MHFKNKVVWITGASSGIGAALATALAAQGAKLILTARNTDALTQVQQGCTGAAGCVVLPADMLHTEALDALAAEAIAVWGRVDFLILNAGKSQRSTTTETSMQVYRHLMELNFFAPLQLTKTLLPHFAKNSGGHIVAIGSVAGLMGFPLRSGYAASKHALKGFFETLQTEHNIPGLHITIVSPGRVNTPISLHALTADGTPHGAMDKGQINGIPVQVCASRIMAAVAAQKKHIIIAQNERLLWWIWWYLRPLYYRIARKKGLPQPE